MKKENLTVGKMARLNGISEQTLRLYDKKGLLVPSKINKETGYRYYNIKQCAKLDMIQYMKSLDMTLSEIKQCFEAEDGMAFRSVLDKQKIEIEEKIRELQQAEWAVTRAIDSYERYETAPAAGTPIMEFQEKRYAFMIDTEVNCYSYDMEEYENVLRNIKKQYELHHLPVSYFCNPGNIIRQDVFQAKKLESTEIVLFVDESYADRDDVVEIPEGLYMYEYCNGFGKEEKTIEELMNFVERSEYKVAGDCISEVLIEFPTLKSYDREAFMKLQVPVELDFDL